MSDRGVDDGPLSPWATAATVAGGLVAVFIAVLMAMGAGEESPYTDVLELERQRGDVLEHDLHVCQQELNGWREFGEEEAEESRREEESGQRAPKDLGLPPTRLPLEDTIVLPEIVVEEEPFDPDSSEWSLPPLRLEGQDELRSYLADRAPDGEVSPGPVAE